MSKVGNLRAMFENKGETSPPERGRSPGLSGGPAESPRPLSKIRTSFVAIEKDGRLGLQRDPSSDSILSTNTNRKIGDETEGDAQSVSSVSQDKTSSFLDRLQKSTKSGLQMETIPQSPQHDTSSATQGVAAGQLTGPGSGKTRTDEGQTRNMVRPKDQDGTAKAASSNRGESINGNPAVERDKTKVQGKGPSKGSATKPVSKPSSIATTKATTKAPAKSPTVIKTPTSPMKAPKLPSKTPERAALHPDKIPTPKTPAATSTKAGTSTNGSTPKPASTAKQPPVPVLQVSPSSSLDRGVGFVKPKPKSPTRPVALPAGLTSHTAASATKVNSQRQSLSRQSGSFQMANQQGRSPSRASVSTAATAIGGSRLKRQSSTINRPRPSLGPPPKQPAKDHPVTRREKEVDESFLARMMRPTQASSSKVHEKVQTTPPRKPTVATAPAHKLPAAKDKDRGNEKGKDGVTASIAKKAATKTERVAKKDVAKTVGTSAGNKAPAPAAPKEADPPAPVDDRTDAKGVDAKAEEPKDDDEGVAEQTEASENVKPAETEGQKAAEAVESVNVAEPVAPVVPSATAAPTDVAADTVDATAADAPSAEPTESAATANCANEETASETEPAEPATPSDPALEKIGVPQAMDGTEEKFGSDGLIAAEQPQKREDDTTMAD